MKHVRFLNSTALVLIGTLACASLDACKKDAPGQNNAAAGNAVTPQKAPPVAGQVGGSAYLANAEPRNASGPCPPAGGKVAVGVAPPPRLPVEHQPPIPGPGYVWTPGNWAWNGAVNDYYWTPGLWALPPSIGLLWTPGYWGWNNGIYLFNTGYWGPTVGFYGGINYGFGYGGFGYDGGYWRGNNFYYNRSVNNFGGARINTAYDGRVSVNRAAGRASYNGGRGGVRAQPTTGELAAGRQARFGPSAGQRSHALNAGLDPANRAGVNHGHPATGATAGARGGAAAGASAERHGYAHPASTRSTAEHAYGRQSEAHAQTREYGGSPGAYRGETAHAASSFHGGSPGGGFQPRGPSGGGQAHAPSGGGHAPGGGENRPH